jgi:pyruvate/2-oxoglutarate/acetoin dehydrogenase E1 component
LLSAPEVPVPFAPELEAYYRPNADKIVASIQEMLGQQ